MKKIIVLIFIIAVLSFLISSGIKYTKSGAASVAGIITAWVAVNPLVVEISCPKEVKINKVFVIRAEIKNQGGEEIKNTKAEIFLPQELKLIKGSKEQEIGILSPKKRKFIFWLVKGEKVGNYIVLVKVSGRFKKELIANQDSRIVKIKERRFFNWRFPFNFWQRFFRFKD